MRSWTGWSLFIPRGSLPASWAWETWSRWLRRPRRPWRPGEAEQLQEKLASETFTLEDMLDQYRRMRKMGSLQSIMEMIPGLKGSGAEDKIDEKGMKREEAIILSMTCPSGGTTASSGRADGRAIARGSGTSVFEVNRFLKKFEKTCLMMKKMSRSSKYQAQVLSQLGAGEARRTPVSVRIRLKRFGTKKRPFYRIVVMDSRTPRDGRVLEEIGLYHPIEKLEKQIVHQR